MITSRIGCEQQTRRLPSAGFSSGSGWYTTAPETNPLSQVWQTPVRHDQRTGTSQASASSRMFPYSDAFQCATIPLRAKETTGPVHKHHSRQDASGNKSSWPPGLTPLDYTWEDSDRLVENPRVVPAKFGMFSVGRVDFCDAAAF